MNHHLILFGTVMMAVVGVAVGFAIGDLVRRYRQNVEHLDAFRRQLPQPYSAVLYQQRQLREIRGILNDLHKMVRTVSKGLEKRPS